MLRFFLLSNKSKGALRIGQHDGHVKKLYDVPLWDIKDCLELKLAFDGEVLDSKMFLPVVGKGLVEGPILFLRNVVRVTRPDRLRLVELLVDLGLLLDLLFLLLLSFFVLDLLDLGLSFFIFPFLGLFPLLGLFFVILDLLRHESELTDMRGVRTTNPFDFLRDDKLDRIRDEFRVLLNGILDPLLFKIFRLVLL